MGSKNARLAFVEGYYNQALKKKNKKGFVVCAFCGNSQGRLLSVTRINAIPIMITMIIAIVEYTIVIVLSTGCAGAEGVVVGVASTTPAAVSADDGP